MIMPNQDGPTEHISVIRLLLPIVDLLTLTFTSRVTFLPFWGVDCNLASQNLILVWCLSLVEQVGVFSRLMNIREQSLVGLGL